MQKERKSTIILMGMKHCGKSTMAQALNRSWLWDSCDLDDEILALYKSSTDEDKNSISSIRELYIKKGLSGFQEWETQAARQVFSRTPPPRVLSLGGGTIENTQTMEIVKKTGFLIFLHESPDILFSRIMHKGFPPFLDAGRPYESFLELFERRNAMFEKAADAVLRINGRNAVQTLHLLETLLLEQGYGR